jgi:tRNA-specific 2-thiouridylase
MKIVLGFSGGVDSSVSAVLLKKAGHEVHGLYLDIAGEAARESTAVTAEQIGIPLEVQNISEELEQHVCRPFVNAYLSGETPNPCILCNPAVKFKHLLDHADRIGAEYVATGHYARTENGMLLKGRPANDQSYMLCRLTKEQVARTIFPLGCFEKAEVRKLAEDMELSAAHKPDSMEICFIPDKDYIGWLRSRAEVPGEGDFVFHGEVIGRHEGIYRYTVGQRRPGLYQERKLYISKIHADTNRIELALWEELFQTEVHARDFNWIGPRPDRAVRAQVRCRHTKWEMPFCTATPEGSDVDIQCDTPVRAPAAGQSAVLYDGDRVLGGGFID